MKKWDNTHKEYIKKWSDHVADAKKNIRLLADHPPYDQGAFDNYLAWFIASSRVELCRPAYDAAILEDPSLGDNFFKLKYNQLVREGDQTKFAPLINFMVIILILYISP